MVTLKTKARGVEFSYERTPEDDILIRYGRSRTTAIAGSDYDRLVQRFSGQVVTVGTSRDAPAHGSIGEWLQKNVTRTAIASYVAPILVHEGDAVWVDDHTVKFRI